ncbi:hypothetical protein BU25DRAFT_344177 [Macroventuria anomochaeta]|uniref:Uncharacterized protein n=1 Tax=Macroventuria anomochaeta TaxID=301207 RepID=A0ACB6RYH7_9PLEO|nr:uncharacterized protein BU25DRAFT_344177 [Macroventuria anomochaeta]KAF2626198.1 hypothetical protein BU25DRAFT_344177 [Macroventuria anomochaeta]
MAQRRTHRKSKLGCQDCKRRHIKCDEGRPSCVNCTTTERQCVYAPPCPRRVRSTLPHTSTTDVGYTSATTSPSSTLLLPAPELAHSMSTPPSLAASPLLTPASSLQYSAPCSNLNIRHMELLSNFMLETAPSLNIVGMMDLGLMRTIMPVVLSAPYLLLQVLALSALHLSRTRPGQAGMYHAEATSLQIEALTSFDNHLENINGENCEAMLIFASFLGIHSLGEAVITSKSDADGFLDRFVTYLNLHRGVQTVTAEAWALLLRSNISPMLHQASNQLNAAASHAPERATSVTDKLNRLLDDGDMSAENKMACRNAVSRLKMMYQVEYLEDQSVKTQQHSSELIWAWPILLSGIYTDQLQRRQPEALIILCHYAVLLHERRSMWCVDNAGRMLIESVTKSLGSYWRQWLDLPNEVIMNTFMS